MIPVFITGTGTGIGKTIVSIIVSNALGADYWKPVQAGNLDGTDKEVVRRLINAESNCIPEVYNLLKPASPHIAAREENVIIDLNQICKYYDTIAKNTSEYLVIEGAGGLMVPLNDNEFMIDLIFKLKAKVILVSRNYLGSINHSLLTAEVCRQRGVDVAGWIFNDDYMNYKDEIAAWSGYPIIGAIPKLDIINSDVLSEYSSQLKVNLLKQLEIKMS